MGHFSPGNTRAQPRPRPTRDGQLRRIARRADERRALPTNARDQYQKWYERTNRLPDNLPKPARQQMMALRERHLETLTLAREQPQFSALLVDGSGNVWTRRYDISHDLPACGFQCIATFPTPTVWDVFDAGGTWMGPVTIPSGFTPVAISGSAMIGVWRDADDVEHVRVYPIVKRL